MNRSMVIFRAGATDYAVPVEQVREVRLPVGVTAVPDSRVGIDGVVKLGSEAIPVLSVLGASEGYLLMVEIEGRRLCLRVDQVEGVVAVPPEPMGAPPPGQRADLVRGITSIDDNLVLFLDLARLVRWLDSPAET